MVNQLRDQFSAFWQGQSFTQRVVLITLLIAGVALSSFFVSWAGKPNYVVAFSGLSESDAGQIVQKLSEDNIDYQLRNSGTIMVASDQVYEVRLRMAREGLPQGGTVGFELFNGSTLGMTEFSQRVNYQQALEGELERTISSLASVDVVRVHIVIPEKTLFVDEQASVTASVTVKQSPGQGLDSTQVRSITHLVASSVEGLQPENVVVVDVNGNLLASGPTGSGEAASVAQVDSQRAAELAIANQIQRDIQNLLDSVLGPNRSVVQASVSLDWTEIETTKQSYDPNTNAVRSSETISETYTTTGEVTGGVPGAETNLPEGTGAETEGQTGTEYQRTEEITNYEVTQTQTREVKLPGEVERVSLSVLVDGVTDEAQLTALQSAISAAVGIDFNRGDSLVVESLSFDRSYYEEQAAALEETQQTDLYVQIGVAVAGGLVLLGLLWYVQRLLKNLRLSSADAWQPIMVPVSQAMRGGGALPSRLSQELDLPEAGARSPEEIRRALPKVTPKIAPPSPEEEQMQQVVNRLADENPASVAEIIQMWLGEEEPSNG